MTIGNIPKDIRRKPSRHAHILLGYLPTTKLEHITNKASRRRTLANLFHACMSRIVEPLETAGTDGLAMASGDGVVRRTHPILAVYVGDYPEQVLVTGVKNGECPSCPIPRKSLGDGRDYDYRDLNAVLAALDSFEVSDPHSYANSCRDAGVKPIHHPFWQDLPYLHIFRSITPDILHQLYQGVLKHLLKWVKSVFGVIEIDARCRRLPPNHNIRLFMKGISSLSRVSGQEHNQICRILLRLVVDLPLPDGQSPACLIRAVRGLLDFLYLVQYPLHSTETLKLLKDALALWDENKQIFVDLNVRKHFDNIPKLHFLRHYLLSISLHGTTDNYNTEYTERLHIDLAKDAYRATNHVDEYTQMTLWLERREKIYRHQDYISWLLAGKPPPVEWHPPDLFQRPKLQMTKHPSRYSVLLGNIINNYGATYFRDAFATYWAQLCSKPDARPRDVRQAADDYILPFQKVSAFHKIKFFHTDPEGYTGSLEVQDPIHTRPAR
jgi:hypothetical protein